MKCSVDAFYVFYLNESQIFGLGQIYVVIYIYVYSTHRDVFDLVTVLCCSEASSHTAVKYLPFMLCC